MDVIASGDNKISFHLRSGMQVDVRLLPPDSFGAAMQYFTGSKAHNVALRQRALKMGYTLNEYSLATLEGEKPVAGKTEEEIYAKLKLDYIPPEMRENLGEIDLAQSHALPKLITEADIQGDVHMHTVETDGKNTIEEMAEAARARGYKYMAITDHSKNLAFANGLDDKRAVEHIARIHEVGKKIDGITHLRRNRSRHPRRRRSRPLRRRARADGSRHRQRALRLQPGTGEDDRATAEGRSRIRIRRSSDIPPAAFSCGATPTTSTCTRFSPPPRSTRSRWN